MKVCIIVFLSLCVAGTVMGFDDAVYEQADVITTFSQSLIIGGSNLSFNLFDLDVNEGGVKLDLDIVGNYDLNYQSPDWDIDANNLLTFATSIDNTTYYDYSYPDYS